MATNHSRTLYKDYADALLGKQKAEELTAQLNRQCKKLELYAVIKTYLKTCVRNGINEMDALMLIYRSRGAPQGLCVVTP